MVSKYPLNPEFYFLERPDDPKYTAPFAAYDRIRALPPLSTLQSPLRSILHVSSASDSLSNCISWQPRPASARTPDPSEAASEAQLR